MPKNKDFLAPWNRPPFMYDPAAPHNKDPDNQEKPWNKPFWHPEDLSVEEQKYYCIYFEYYSFKKYVYGTKRI